MRYALPRHGRQPASSPWRSKGLAPNGPIGKPRVFSMLNGTGRLDLSKYQMNVQYRGRQGNPDNCIAFKAVWGDEDVKLEPELHERQPDRSGMLDPGRTVLLASHLGCADLPAHRPRRRDRRAARSTTGRRHSPPGYGPYAPNPHYAYLGANELGLGGEDGTVPNITIRNVWLSDQARPTALGSALRVQ